MNITLGKLTILLCLTYFRLTMYSVSLLKLFRQQNGELMGEFSFLVILTFCLILRTIYTIPKRNSLLSLFILTSSGDLQLRIQFPRLEIDFINYQLFLASKFEQFTVFISAKWLGITINYMKPCKLLYIFDVRSDSVLPELVQY